MDVLVAYADSPDIVYCSGKKYTKKVNGMWREKYNCSTCKVAHLKPVWLMIREYERGLI